MIVLHIVGANTVNTIENSMVTITNRIYYSLLILNNIFQTENMSHEI